MHRSRRILVLLASLGVACAHDVRAQGDLDTRPLDEPDDAATTVRDEAARDRLPDPFPGEETAPEAVDASRPDGLDALEARDVTDASPPADATPTPDAPATDLPPPPPACCRTAADCPGGQTCARPSGSTNPGFGVCAALPVAGRCWDDAGCDLGEECLGAGLCSCQVDCDLAYAGPGVCKAGGSACSPIDPGWVGETCDAASRIVFDGTRCVGTCPGCCDCEPFCELTFASLEECESRCTRPPAECSPWTSSLAEGPFTYLWDAAPPDACPRAIPLAERCRTDADCPRPGPGARAGTLCLFGSCVECTATSQCPDAATVCIMGRCEKPDQSNCPPPLHSDAEPGCSYHAMSDYPCAVGTCDTPFDTACNSDSECLAVDDHPFQRCALLRCGFCTRDDDCVGPGRICVPPGVCLAADPPASRLSGAWLLRGQGTPIHAGYLRFEFDGGLRRARFDAGEGWLDDVPALPCTESSPVWPLRGTWEPLDAGGGVLRVRMTLNLACAARDGLRSDWDVVFPEGSDRAATFREVASGTELEGRKVPASQCDKDFARCPAPAPAAN